MFWSSPRPWTCNGDLQAPSPKGEKSGQHKDQVQLGETQGPQHHWIFSSFQFAPLLALENQDTEIDVLINSFNTVVTETANNILGKHQPAKKPWVTDNILKLCDKRRELKHKKNTTEGAKLYREANQPFKKRHEKGKGDMDWRTMPRCQRKPAEKQQQESLPACDRADKLETRRTTTIQDKAGKCLTEEQDILKRWTEYCSELYTHTTTGDPKVPDVPPPVDNDSYPILWDKVEAAVKSLKKGKSSGVDNIPSELVQAGGEAMTDMLLIICNKIWQTGEWPTPWTQSLIITLPKKGNLHLC